MIYSVFFKTGDRLAGRILEYLDVFHREKIRGLGEVHIVESRGRSIYFVPIQEDFSFNAKRYEKSFVAGVGAPTLMISLVRSENLVLHPTGNISNRNPLLHPSFNPRTVSPVDPDLLGTLWTALNRVGLNPELQAVHDPPSNLDYPHIRLGLPVDMVDYVIPALIASVRKPKIFVPYLTVSTDFSARYFYKLFEKRLISSYHVPYYWKHFLDTEMFEQMKKKGNVRKVLVQRGLVLPGELPQKEV